MRFRVGAVVALLAAFGLSGCGGPKLVSVSGKVLLNGKPFKDADIVFVADSSNKDGVSGSDRTGPEGNYTVMANGRIGLVPGKYKVLISKTLVDLSRIPKVHQDDPYMARLTLYGHQADMDQQGLTSAKPAEIKAEFDREVPAGGTVFDFDVKSEVPSS